MLEKPRTANMLGFLACAALIAFALYAQYGLGLEPCPLCIFQRIAIMALGAVFVIAALHNPGPGGRRAYAVLVGVAAGSAVGVAGRHLWLQSLPPERVPACGPGLDYMLDAFPFTEMLRTVLSGTGECAQVDWTLLGLSIPGWVMISAIGLGAFGIWANWRSPAGPDRSSGPA